MKYQVMQRNRGTREKGNVLVISFLLVTLLTALATAHFATVQKNSRQSTFVNDLGDLRRYAETGVNLALHEMNYDVGGADGNLGTEMWTVAGDRGKDGLAGTSDEGEGDGIPTPGEPNLAPLSIGPTATGMRLIVSAADSAWPGVKRVVSTAFRGTVMATVEVYAQEAANSVPGVGAAYVQPGVVLDLNGNAFLISGNDTNPDGSAGPQPAVHGIATATGSPPGSNQGNLVDQVPTGREDQIVGLGGIPSIGETSSLDFDQVFNAFMAARDNDVTPGTYSNVTTWGNYDASSFRVTYCNGDVHLSGNCTGAGALVVEGDLTISGEFTFVGVVIVRGDVKLVGAGSGVHVYGSTLIGQTFSAIDPDPELGITGSADIRYSSAALAAASGLLGSRYNVLYWNDIK